MDLNKVLAGLTSSGVLGGVAGGAVAGAVMGNKTARKHAGTLLQVGGIAALGGLAWQAYQGYKTRDPAAVSGPVVAGPAPAGADSRSRHDWDSLSRGGFELEAGDGRPGSRAVLVVRAMITAAAADGHLDGEERARIMDRVAQLKLAPDEKALVVDALQQPPSLAELCAEVDSPELATEIYLSSLLAVDHQVPAAGMYLDALAYRLGLPGELVARLNGEAGRLLEDPRGQRVVA